MKRAVSVLAVLLGLLWAQPASAAWTLKAHTSLTTAAFGTTSSIDTTGADLIVVCFVDYEYPMTSTVSDNKSNSWTTLTRSPTNSGRQQSCFYTQGGTVGSGHTFTSAGTCCQPDIFVMAFSGSTASPLDAENEGHSSTTTTQSTGSVTPSANGALIVSFITGRSDCSGAATSYTVNSSLTIVESNSSTIQGAMAWYEQPTAGAINPTWTAGANFCAEPSAKIIAFKAGGGGGGATSHPCGPLKLLGVGCEVQP